MKHGFTFFLLLATLIAVGCGKPAEEKETAPSESSNVVTDMNITKPGESK